VGRNKVLIDGVSACDEESGKNGYALEEDATGAGDTMAGGAEAEGDDQDADEPEAAKAGADSEGRGIATADAFDRHGSPKSEDELPEAGEQEVSPGDQTGLPIRRLQMRH